MTTETSRTRRVSARLRRARASVVDRGRAVAAGWRRYLLVAGALAVIPFGSYGELQKRLVDGSLTKTVPQGRFIVNEIDDAGTVSWRISATKRTPPQVPAIYLLGGSSMRECLPSPASLNTALGARQETATTVRILAASNETYAQNLAIVDNLPAAAGGIVVIAVHHAQFKVARSAALDQLKGVGLLMKSPALLAFLERRLDKDLSNNLRPGLDAYLKTYRAVRGVEPFRGQAVPYRLHRYTVDDRWRDASKTNWLKMWLREYGQPGGAFDDYFAFNAACLTETVKVARAKGYEVVLMRCPENTYIIKGALDRYKAKYMELVDTLVAEQGAHFADPNDTAKLTNADFRDLYHLIGNGRTKWQRALADDLAPVLIDHFPPEGASPSPSTSATTSQSPATSVASSVKEGEGAPGDGALRAGLLDLIAQRLAGLR